MDPLCELLGHIRVALLTTLREVRIHLDPEIEFRTAGYHPGVSREHGEPESKIARFCGRAALKMRAGKAL